MEATTVYNASMDWQGGIYPNFKCPLCGSHKYVEVRVRLRSGNWHTTEFYQCFHCTVMFRDPVLFTRQKSHSETDKYSPAPRVLKTNATLE